MLWALGFTLAIFLVVSTFVSFTVAFSTGESILKVKKEYGIIFNPLKHFYLVHKEEYSPLETEFFHFFVFEPGWYLLQFIISASMIKFLSFNSFNSFDNWLKKKYDDEKE